MTAEDRHERMEAARMRSELTVQDLWPRYVALGGTGDAFDLDGYLQGLVPLESFQQDVLAQALNEALDDLYTAHHVPLSAGSADGLDEERSRSSWNGSSASSRRHTGPTMPRPRDGHPDGIRIGNLTARRPAVSTARTSVAHAAGSGNDRAESLPPAPVLRLRDRFPI
jgi:hypothetical protein